MKRIIFMGTPVFACAILQQLLNDHANVIAVVSQPDKLVGRQQVLTPTPVKELATKHGIAVLQPASIKTEYDAIVQLQPDLILTCAYGQFVPKAVLDLAPCGSINVHASLLPKLRGGAPIHKAIMYGHSHSGITLMKMAVRMDAGAMYAQESVAIAQEDTVGTLSDKLMTLGAKMVHSHLPAILEMRGNYIPQDEKAVTFATNISKEEEKIDFTKDHMEIYNHMRALIPWPVSYALMDGKKMKFWQVSLGEVSNDSYASGDIVQLCEQGLKIKAGDGYIYVAELQPEGKKRMSAKEFMNGVGRAYKNARFQ